MSERKWRPISARERRIIGVLVEKAKTVPDQYPLSLNALVSGCNQKNNRYPLMEVEADDLEEPLEKLKQVGAVVEVQGSSRVARFKHTLYEWLGVDKVELAVMAELLLRGAQTEGELRGRASRMEPIADLGSLRTVLDGLKAKGLVLSLTPEGRGHVITHALYEERELQKVKAEYEGQSFRAAEPEPRAESRSEPQSARQSEPPQPAAAPAPSPPSQELLELRFEVSELREQLTKLREEFDQLAAALR
jgi:uncharacterized protein YceH (UPF0502 family)